MPIRNSPAFGPLTTTRYAINGVSFDMVRVPPGRFIDGEDLDRRELLVSRPFEIGSTQVTQALWQAVMGSSPSRFSAPDRPVEQVSWDQVQGFLSRLDSLGLRGFRLPTEPEWVWAVRCGVSADWAGSDRGGLVAVAASDRTAPVAGLFSAPVGAFDFSGNVWEWLSDSRVDPPVAGIDVQSPALGGLRVRRGGGWMYAPEFARVFMRRSLPPSQLRFFLGFRLLRASKYSCRRCRVLVHGLAAALTVRAPPARLLVILVALAARPLGPGTALGVLQWRPCLPALPALSVRLASFATSSTASVLTWCAFRRVASSTARAWIGASSS